MQQSKRTLWFPLSLFCLFLLSGCAAGMLDSLEKLEATPVPGTAPKLHAASASEANVDVMEASLYYRFLSEPMLAAEIRTLTVPRDESMEYAVVKAILEGPSAGYSDLVRLFPSTAAVESVTPRGNILFITFNEALLTDDGIPGDWAHREEWMSEAPLLRKLTIQSVVASITESFSYTGVQILVNRQAQTETSMRLDNAYFLSDLQGLSEPQTREESLLLTPQNTARRLLQAWKAANHEALYTYLSNLDYGNPKPAYQDVVAALDAVLPTLTEFTLHGGGSVSGDGQTAVLTVDLAFRKEGVSEQWTGYPLILIRENGLWRIRYSQIQRLMSL